MLIGAGLGCLLVIHCIYKTTRNLCCPSNCCQEKVVKESNNEIVQNENEVVNITDLWVKQENELDT